MHSPTVFWDEHKDHMEDYCCFFKATQFSNVEIVLVPLKTGDIKK